MPLSSLLWLNSFRNGISLKRNGHFSKSKEKSSMRFWMFYDPRIYDAEQEKGHIRFSGESKNLPSIWSKPVIFHH